MLKEKIRVGNLNTVFGYRSDNDFFGRIARICVLFEDLRIELAGLDQRPIKAIDKLDDTYRRYYFLRRSIATLNEFAEAVRLLNDHTRFVEIGKEFDSDAIIIWNKSTRWFRNREKYLGLMRNDIGGHFGQQAALYAVSDLPDSYVGKIELKLNHAKRGVDVRLYFASQIVVSAMFRHKRDKSDLKHFKYLLRLSVLGYKHAIRVAHCVAGFYLLDRFK